MLQKLCANLPQKQFYSDKKKRYTFKSQLVVTQLTGETICTEGILRGHNSSVKMPPFVLVREHNASHI